MGGNPSRARQICWFVSAERVLQWACSTSSLNCSEGCVGYGSQEPRSKWSVDVKLRDALVGSDKGLLHHILCHSPVAGNQGSRTDRLETVLLDQVAQAINVANAHLLDRFPFCRDPSGRLYPGRPIGCNERSLHVFPPRDDGLSTGSALSWIYRSWPKGWNRAGELPFPGISAVLHEA
jgi:hypothetical protein